MGLFSFFQESIRQEWIPINEKEQLTEIQNKSNTKPQVIFKHSTTCSISRMAKSRMEDGLTELNDLADIYYLDLLAHRGISNAIAEKWNIQHESPQVIIIKNGICVYSSSHNLVQPSDLIKHLG